MLTMGVDIGSAEVKAIAIADSKVRAYASVPIEYFDIDGAVRGAVSLTLNRANANEGDLRCIAYTGSEVNAMELDVEKFSEPISIARGAQEIAGSAGVVLQLGNMHSLAVKVAGGKALRILRNDSCASGTGRYLHIVADVLGVDISDLDKMAEASDELIELQSTCAIFAESEVISLLHSRVSPENIAKGALIALARRVYPMMETLDNGKPVLLTGGVARSKCLCDAMRSLCRAEVIVPEEPVFVGALGAALLAEERGAGTR